jgi:DNA-nicking Smr family endonuclease
MLLQALPRTSAKEDTFSLMSRGEEDDDFYDEDAPVTIPPGDTIDLHSFRPSEIRDVAREFLEQARRSGHREVRLIHGRGIGAQRDNVRRLLGSLDWVEAFHDAGPTGGGWGATIAILRLDD